MSLLDRPKIITFRNDVMERLIIPFEEVKIIDKKKSDILIEEEESDDDDEEEGNINKDEDSDGEGIDKYDDDDNSSTNSFFAPEDDWIAQKGYWNGIMVNLRKIKLLVNLSLTSHIINEAINVFSVQNHPNLVKLYGLTFHNSTGYGYIVHECTDLCLRDFLQKDGNKRNLTFEVKINLILQLISAVRYLLSKRVRCGITTSNIFVQTVINYDGIQESGIHIDRHHHRIRISDYGFLGISLCHYFFENPMEFLEAPETILLPNESKHVSVGEEDEEIEEEEKEGEVRNPKKKKKKIVRKTVKINPKMNEEVLGEKSLVYSFSMVVYEILFQRSPYFEFDVLESSWNRDKLMDRITGNEKLRPKLTETGVKLPKELVGLMKRCWKTDPNDRPTFKEISEVFMKNHNFLG